MLCAASTDSAPSWDPFCLPPALLCPAALCGAALTYSIMHSPWIWHEQNDPGLHAGADTCLTFTMDLHGTVYIGGIAT